MGIPRLENVLSTPASIFLGVMLYLALVFLVCALFMAHYVLTVSAFNEPRVYAFPHAICYAKPLTMTCLPR